MYTYTFSGRTLLENGHPAMELPKDATLQYVMDKIAEKRPGELKVRLVDKVLARK